MNYEKNLRAAKITTTVVAMALLAGLTSCSSMQTTPTPSTTTMASTARSAETSPPSSTDPLVPPLIGKTVGEARRILQPLNIRFGFKGPDGNTISELIVTVPDSAKISGAVPKVGSAVPKGNMLVLDIDVTQYDLYEVQTAASAKASADAAAARATPLNAFGNGTYVVGKDVEPGTYQVQVPRGANGVHDCYWERTTPQGGTIANDFVTFAPQGPIVTVYTGEGFVSERCGTWSKVG